MKRYLILLFFAVINSGCSQQDPEKQLQHLNGYWEIERVEFSKDSIKEFRINENIDYIELKNGEGFRARLRPQLDGGFKHIGDLDKVEAEIRDYTLYLNYSTLFDSWQETVVSASENKISIKNSSGIIYHYKRYEPLLDLTNEKE